MIKFGIAFNGASIFVRFHDRILLLYLPIIIFSTRFKLNCPKPSVSLSHTTRSETADDFGNGFTIKSKVVSE
jgi:hypothetical protein